MKFILFNLVVTGALVFLIMDKGGTTIEIPTVAEVQGKVEAVLDRAAPRADPTPQSKASIRNTTAPVEAVLGDDLAPAANKAVQQPPSPPAAVSEPEHVREIEVASAFEAPAVSPLPPAPPELSPEVAKRRAEVLGADRIPARRDVRPVLHVSKDERVALTERRLKLQDLAEEMEIMAAEATFR